MFFVKVSFLLALLCIYYSSAIPIPCNCGLGTGTNICKGRSCTPQIVRPRPLPCPDYPRSRVVCKHVGGLEPLRPLGDLCSCGQTIVKPAYIPKPDCSGCGRIRNIHNRGENYQYTSGNEDLQLDIALNEGERAILLGEGNLPSGGTYVVDEVSDGYINRKGQVVVDELVTYTNGNQRTVIDGITKYPNGNERVVVDGIGRYPNGNGVVIVDGVPTYPNGDGSTLVNPLPTFPEGIDGIPTVYSDSSYRQPGQYRDPYYRNHGLVPADPVSQSLAHQRNIAKNTYLSDSKLQFGFHQLPKDVPIISQIKTSIPEDNIHKVIGPVLELKYTSNNGGGLLSVDEEAIVDLAGDPDEDAETEPIGSSNIRKITLGELGYGLEKRTNTKFVNVDLDDSDERERIGRYGRLGGLGDDSNVRCNDGYRGGQVLVKHKPTLDIQDSLSGLSKTFVGSAHHSGGSYEDDCLDGYDSLTGPSYTFSASSASSSLSSSSSNNEQSSVLFEKLIYN